MHPLASTILITWRRNAAYGLRLVEGLASEQFVAQPMGWAREKGDASRGMNHPAWILGHLNLYCGVADAMARGVVVIDPAEDRFGPKSRPLADISAYPSPALLVQEFREGHDAAAKSLEAATREVLEAPPAFERWRVMHPTVGDMLVTLMVKHESGHLGQLSAWRRAMGLAPVAV